MRLGSRGDLRDQRFGLRARVVGPGLDRGDDIVGGNDLPPLERCAQQVVTRGEVPVERAFRRLQPPGEWLHGEAVRAFVQQHVDGGFDPIVAVEPGVRHRAYASVWKPTIRQRTESFGHGQLIWSSGPAADRPWSAPPARRHRGAGCGKSTLAASWPTRSRRRCARADGRLPSGRRRTAPTRPT